MTYLTTSNRDWPEVNLEKLMQLAEEIQGIASGMLKEIRGGSAELIYLYHRIDLLRQPFSVRLVEDTNVPPGTVDMVFGSGRKERSILWKVDPK